MSWNEEHNQLSGLGILMYTKGDSTEVQEYLSRQQESYALTPTLSSIPNSLVRFTAMATNV